MNRVKSIILLAVLGLIFMTACSRTSASTIPQIEPVIFETSKGIPAEPVQVREIAVSTISKEALAVSHKENQRDFSETAHLWMSLLAIKNNDVNDARHHLGDAMAFVKEPERRAEIQKLLWMMSKGDLFNAEHGIEEMAGGESISKIQVQRYHLQLTGRFIENRDSARVKRHMLDFMTDATDKQKAIAADLIQKSEKSDFYGAENDLVELIKK